MDANTENNKRKRCEIVYAILYIKEKSYNILSLQFLNM